ncbi:MAG TPA: hydrogen gas-evolving membrane-bound hydrogenase subunit E [Acidimicrobiales bacterium]|nr:hydrogen gas-evolving membrane-bound hydrogenase subunit E [Acidimicrobiales bacterium]
MTRSVRFTVFGLGAVGLAVLGALAIMKMPAFGGANHLYRNHAVPAAVSHNTANVVSSVNFDQRGLDTLGEETILLASVIAVSVLLRPEQRETERRPLSAGRVLDATMLVGWIMLPVTLIVGLDVVAHGHLTPGGGFQGGVILGTGIHLVYVAGTYRMLDRVRPVRSFEWGEALGAGAFACLGIAGLVVGVAFLQNIIPTGSLGTLFSAGTVPVLNGAVGIEVASSVIVLISKFLEQAITVRTKGEGKGSARAGQGEVR